MSKVDYQKLEREALDLPTVGFKRNHPDAILPVKGHDLDSGFDLYALEDTVIYPGATAVVKTGISVSLPEGLDATVRPRSGNTSKTKLRVPIGTVDNPYTGDIGVMVHNTSTSWHVIGMFTDILDGIIEALPISEEDKTDMFAKYEDKFYVNTMQTLNPLEPIRTKELYPIGTYIVKRGDKIAQLVIHPYYDKQAIEVDYIDETDRGSNGFGSTDKKEDK